MTALWVALAALVWVLVALLLVLLWAVVATALKSKGGRATPPVPPGGAVVNLAPGSLVSDEDGRHWVVQGRTVHAAPGQSPVLTVDFSGGFS
jgi:uncharacterized iron-regulated membrane protein